MSVWSAKNRGIPSRKFRVVRAYGHTTTAMHGMSTSPIAVIVVIAVVTVFCFFYVVEFFSCFHVFVGFVVFVSSLACLFGIVVLF